MAEQEGNEDLAAFELKSMMQAARHDSHLRVSADLFRAARHAAWKYKFRDPHIPCYMPLSVEEAALATELSRWSNTRVRIIGVARYNEIPWLVSFNEKGGPFKVALDVSSAKHHPPYDGTPIQVFGLLEIESTLKWPQVCVMFFRRLEHGPTRYSEALKLLNKFVPRFIK